MLRTTKEYVLPYWFASSKSIADRGCKNPDDRWVGTKNCFAVLWLCNGPPDFCSPDRLEKVGREPRSEILDWITSFVKKYLHVLCFFFLVALTLLPQKGQERKFRFSFSVSQPACIKKMRLWGGRGGGNVGWTEAQAGWWVIEYFWQPTLGPKHLWSAISFSIINSAAWHEYILVWFCLVYK